jgi:hypothetical protein
MQIMYIKVINKRYIDGCDMRGNKMMRRYNSTRKEHEGD